VATRAAARCLAPVSETRTLKAANATKRRCRRESAAIGMADDTAGAAVPESAAPILQDISAVAAAAQEGLTVRAENVLKELAAELTGEDPPKGRWTPPCQLLQKLTFKDLLTARNCGPQTTAEIVRWANAQGVTIEQPFHAGKSLSAMWRDLVTKCSNGEFARAEIAEALQRSTRRKNTRIPVAFQNILLKVLNSTGQ
jgi:hypothetical protein